MTARVHLRVPYRNVERDPTSSFRRWEAFVFELNLLGAIVLTRTTDHVDIAVPAPAEQAARDIARLVVDPTVLVVPRLVRRVVQTPGDAA